MTWQTTTFTPKLEDAPVSGQIAYFATVGEKIAQMMATPMLAELGKQLAEDLMALRIQTRRPAELAEGYKEIATLRDARKQRGLERMAQQGPGMWKEWHLRALKGDPTDVQEERKWLERFANRLPCGECKQHFLELIHTLFRDGFESYFARTVEAHNIVNRRRGVVGMEFEEAKRLWTALSGE